VKVKNSPSPDGRPVQPIEPSVHHSDRSQNHPKHLKTNAMHADAAQNALFATVNFVDNK
jgi:hypothetical protein